MNAFAIDTRFGMSNTGSAVNSGKMTGISPIRSPLVTEAQLLEVLGLPNILLGTGGDLANALTYLSVRRTSGSRASSIAKADQVDYIEPGKLISEVINVIRKTFGLSVTDLASVLGVERPTVYTWLKDQATPAPARIRRMGIVLRLADTWTARTDGTVAPVLSARTRSGLALLEALKEPKLWESEIVLALNAQATSITSRGRRSRLSVLARERGLEVLPASEFDLATGRPLGPED